MDKKRILLVDDEEDLLELLKVRITSWGFEVIEAKNGKEAIEATSSKKPDIVILDYKMPDMDGLTVLKKIRKICATLPVIMFTVHPDVKVQEEARKLGVSAFVPKLSAYQDVQEALKSAINIVQRDNK